MSEPKRYMVYRTVQVPCGCVQDELIDCKDSNPRCETFVAYSDYALLKAEVERLRFIGDEIIMDVYRSECLTDKWCKMARKWDAAKGVQS